MKEDKENLQKNQEKIHKNMTSGQKVSPNGKIIISKTGWLFRISLIIGISGISAYILFVGIQTQNLLVILSFTFPIRELIVMSSGWFFYRNSVKTPLENKLVSVLIPVFNEEALISTVIAAIANSTYKNIEMIAINDGSTDGTKRVLNELKQKYSNLKVIHQKNTGKRGANGAGFAKSKGDFIVFIDSDSIIDHRAIEEFVKTFSFYPSVGAVGGHVKLMNVRKNLLTKIQDSWYDYAFNIVKSTESVFQNVICCPGCLAGYRREAICDFIPIWDETNHAKDHGQAFSFKSNPWKNNTIAKIAKRILLWISQFDDAEDITLTSQTLVDWKSVYVSTAIVYTDVPVNMMSFFKQQLRWKKGWIRAGFFLMTFIWRKHPLISLVFYLNFVSSFIAPLTMLMVFFYFPLVLNEYLIPVLFLVITVMTGLAQGADYKLRDNTSVYWKYKPLISIITEMLIPWLLIPSLLTLRKNQWFTR